MSDNQTIVLEKLDQLQNEVNEIYSIISQVINYRIELIAEGKPMPKDLVVDGSTIIDMKRILNQRVDLLENEVHHLRTRIANFT